MPEVIFTGPAGRIEGRYHPARQKNAPIAIVLHPHPQFGGTMNHQIVNYGKIAMGEGVGEVIHDLMVHRAAKLRVRMQHDGDRGVLLACRVVPALDPSSRTGKDDFRHEPPRTTATAATRCGGRVTYSALDGSSG